MSSSIRWNASNYRQFIRDFREAAGIGTPSTSASIEVEAGAGRAFRYAGGSLYLTEVREPNRTWQQVSRGNYAQMGIVGTTITGGQIRTSITNGYALGGPVCAAIVLVTSEAARSQVVYQIVQQLLHSPRTAKWDDLLPLLRVWGQYTTHNHKHRPIQYGPLGVRDYYRDPDVLYSLTALRGSGFQIDE